MPTYVETWQGGGRERAVVESDRLSIGKSPGNDLVVRDPAVSRLHAVVEGLGSGWVIRDLGSRNGTFVNGERVRAEQALHSGDEIRVGNTRLTFRADAAPLGESSTAAAATAPVLTPREREVLLALCRPLLAGDLITPPATTVQIADELFLSEDAAKKHLQRLYRKFELTHEDPSQRRARLANEAIRRGAISVSELNDGVGPLRGT